VPVRLKGIRTERPRQFGDVYLALALWRGTGLATFRRKIDVSGIEVSWLPQNKTRRGERRARVGLD
jgi:hypothetical protein